MRLFRCLTLLLVATTMMLPPSFAYAAELKRVIVVRPDENHPFWELFESASRSACASLGCEVESIKANWDQVKMAQRLEARLKQEPKPDLVLFQSFKRNGRTLLELAEKYKVHAFLVNADLDAEQHAVVGGPREKLKYWLGSMMPDDARGGALMAQHLHAQALKKGLARDGVVHFVGIEGNIADGASIERVKGLRSFLQKTPNAKMAQVVSAKWLTPLATEQTRNLLRRYPGTRVIWSVGDTTAVGVIAGIKEAGKVPGTDILTAGLDWSTEGLEAVKKGELEGDVGGHFMEGAWAIVAAYDYMQGHDFAKTDGVTMRSSMALITKANVDTYLSRYGKGDFSSINFKDYSKHFNPSLKRYSLDFSGALK